MTCSPPRATRPPWQLGVAAAVGLALLLLVAACGGGGGRTGAESPRQVRGLIVLVTPRSLTEVETLRIRDGAGRVWTFTTQGPVEITPSHLLQHQLQGESVLVIYIAKGDTLVAVKVTD